MKQFKTESKRILDLMINSIYTNKEIFLRELISNASDAIDKLKFISLTENDVRSNFEINIKVDKDNGQLIIEDNGIGMTEAELEKNLGTVAESGTLAFKKENENSEKELIGQFGVGFYSAFMVADKIEVYSKAHKSDKAYKWESCGAEGYTVTETDKETVGTKIVLTLKKDTDDCRFSEFLESYKITSLIKKYSDYVRYPIKMLVKHSKLKEGLKTDKPEYEDVYELETLNSMVPLWKKQKADVKDEELNEFYKNEFHDYEDPLKSIFAKIEGTLTYDTLLFIPKNAPFDYYSKDYKKGVKLYCNGVMIMEKCEELIPDYFGFIRGIVDSSDLSLNISREILQQNRQVKAIATSLEKKILSELNKMLEEDRENYDKFFNTFGLSIKYGIYSSFGMNKDKLKDLLTFYSGKREKNVTLKEYVKEMQADQQNIFYACGDSYDNIKNLPQIEKAKEKGIEILFFKDNVDEFVAKILNEYDGKVFKNVSDADFNIDSDEEKKDLSFKEESMKDTLSYIKDKLKDKVKDVKLSNKLKTYPVCLTATGDVSIEMEKVLNTLPNADGKIKAEKILEINASHKIADTLQELFNSDKEKLDKYCTVLYEEARLTEGLNIEDVAGFIGAINEIM